MENTEINPIFRLALKGAGLGISFYYVGGCVRDQILGNPCEDIDLAVSGCGFDTLIDLIKPTASRITSEAVGGSFAVVKAVIEGQEYDFALCRGEVKTGNGHSDFAMEFGVTIEQDLLRRDLTINAVAICALTGKIIDPFGGQTDLSNGVAREVSSAFAEDPLRVLRAARFCARFNLAPSASLIEICKSLDSKNISAERFGMELLKAMKQASKPSVFFTFLQEVGWLETVFPELHALMGVSQDPIHHPEGDAFEHTLCCIDAASDWFTRIVMACHDLGKASTTKVNPKTGRLQALGHELASVPLTDSMLKRIVMESAPGFGGKKTISRIKVLVELHMLHTCKGIKNKSLADKANTLHQAGLTFGDLVKVMKADESGRPPIQPDFSFIEDMEERVASMTAEGRFTPIVTASMLMARGMKPSIELGEKIKAGFILQLAGSLNEDNWFKLLKA